MSDDDDNDGGDDDNGRRVSPLNTISILLQIARDAERNGEREMMAAVLRRCDANKRCEQ